MSELTIKIQGLSRKQVVIGLSGLSASIAIAAVAIFFLRQSTGLGPVADGITSFKPYFFGRTIPANYTFNKSSVAYSNGVLIVPLTKSGSPTVVLTEQAMSSKLSESDLLQNGSPVVGALHPASVNSVEGRQVGVMAASADKTLILINAPESVSSDEIATLLKALRPLR